MPDLPDEEEDLEEIEKVDTGFWVSLSPTGHWEARLDPEVVFQLRRAPTPADILPAMATIIEEHKAKLVAGLIAARQAHTHD